MGLAAIDLVALDEPVEHQRQPAISARAGGGEHRGGVAQLLGALDFFGADVEQADHRLVEAVDDPRIGRAHHRILHEVARVGFGVGAQIEHHHIMRLQGRHDRGERGAIDPRHGAQRDLAHRHQRAGVAGTHRSASRACLHRVDGKAHAGGLGAADRAARQFIAADHILAMEDFGRGTQVRVVF